MTESGHAEQLLEELHQLFLHMLSLSASDNNFDEQLQAFQTQEQILATQLRQVLPSPLPVHLEAPVHQVQQLLIELQELLLTQQTKNRESIMSLKGFKKARKAYKQF